MLKHLDTCMSLRTKSLLKVRLSYFWKCQTSVQDQVFLKWGKFERFNLKKIKIHLFKDFIYGDSGRVWLGQAFEDVFLAYSARFQQSVSQEIIYQEMTLLTVLEQCSLFWPILVQKNNSSFSELELWGNSTRWHLIARNCLKMEEIGQFHGRRKDYVSDL